MAFTSMMQLQQHSRRKGGGGGAPAAAGRLCRHPAGHSPASPAASLTTCVTHATATDGSRRRVKRWLELQHLLVQTDKQLSKLDKMLLLLKCI